MTSLTSQKITTHLAVRLLMRRLTTLQINVLPLIRLASNLTRLSTILTTVTSHLISVDDIALTLILAKEMRRKTKF